MCPQGAVFQYSLESVVSSESCLKTKFFDSLTPAHFERASFRLTA